MNEIKQNAQELASYGRDGDTILAHINPQEAELLKLMGGAGTTNPDTGLPEYRFGKVFRQAIRYVAPVAIIVVAVVAPQAIPALGNSILGAMGVTGASATTAAMVGAGAVGAGTSAMNAAVAGGKPADILKAAAIGGAASAAGAGVASGLGPEVLPVGQAGPPVPALVPPPVAAGAGGFTAGFTGAQLAGQNLEKSLRTGGISGGSAALTSALFGTPEGQKPTTGEQIARTVGGTAIRESLGNLFAPQRQASGRTGGGPTSQFVGSTPTTGEPAPSPTALGQALRIGSGEPGAPIESPGGGGETTTKPVWNIASLRVKDEGGGEA